MTPLARRFALEPLPANPLVSVIVPSYNQGGFIGETLESILDQSYRPIEILVMDGASRDGTLEVLRSFDGVPELKWWSEPDRGVAHAVNKGFARASGPVCAIQSSDDAYLPGALEEAVDALRRQPPPGLVYADIVTVDENGREMFRSNTRPFRLDRFLAKRGTSIPQPAAFFRTEIARALGGWNEAYFNADTELWLRMVFRTDVRKVDRFWARRRRHPGQRNTRAAEIVESYGRMIESSADLAAASRRLRRAARCGRFMHAAKYNPTDSWLAPYYLRWRAVLSHPPVADAMRLPDALVPSFARLRGIARRLFVGGFGR